MPWKAMRRGFPGAISAAAIWNAWADASAFLAHIVLEAVDWVLLKVGGED